MFKSMEAEVVFIKTEMDTWNSVHLFLWVFHWLKHLFLHVEKQHSHTYSNAFHIIKSYLSDKFSVKETRI